MSEGHAGGMVRSPLVQSLPNQAAQIEHQHIVEARRKFSSLLESSVLDYLHYSPEKLEACVDTLRKIFGNVLANPSEQKYRRVKDSSRIFQANIASIMHADKLLLQAGWHTKVLEMQKHWVFEEPEDSLKFKAMAEAKAVLDRAHQTLQDKAERKRKDDEARRGKQNEERDRIRLAIEDDRRQREMLQAATAHVRATAAQPLPSEATAQQQLLRQRQSSGDGGAGGGGIDGGHRLGTSDTGREGGESSD